MVREAVVWLFGLVWLAVIAGGIFVWERYDATPGPATERPAPAVEGRAGNWRLTVFAHPHCPCTRATLGEIAGLLHEVPDLSVRVLFVRPPGTRDGWEQGESWEAANRLPGCEVACDETGREARRFGAETSGEAFLTDPAGAVVFRGGLTRARGRAGGSAGRRAVLDWLGGRAGAAAAPVFGCPLFASGE